MNNNLENRRPSPTQSNQGNACEDYQIARIKSEQLRDLLLLLFKDKSAPLTALATELSEDVAHAIQRLN